MYASMRPASPYSMSKEHQETGFEMSQVITSKLENGVATVTLNRPEALNALSVSMQRDITCAFNSLKRDDTIKAIVFTGSGRAFSAGLDVKELGERGFSDPDYASNKEIAPLKAILEVNKPVIFPELL